MTPPHERSARLCARPRRPGTAGGRAVLLSLALLLASPLAAEEAALRAERISEANRHLRIGGVDAVAGDGDWLLSNGTICASVSDPAHATYLSAAGGALVDLGFCGREDDQWVVLHDLLDLRKENALPCGPMAAAVEPHSATLRCTGRHNGVERTLTYRIDREHPERLEVNLSLQRVESGPRVRLYGTLLLRPHGTLAPFAVSSRLAQRNAGFDLPDPDPQSTLALVRAIRPLDTLWLLGDTQGKPPVAYALRATPAVRTDAHGGRQTLEPFALNGADFSILGYFTAAPLLDDAGPTDLSQLLALPFADLAVGERLDVTQYVSVSRRCDTLDFSEALSGAAAEQALPDLPGDLALLVRDDRGAPITWISPEQPRPPRLRLRGKAPFHAEVYSADRTLVATVPLDGSVAVTPPATGRLQPRVAHPLRLLFFDADGAPAALFDGDYRPLRFGGAARRPGNFSYAVDLLGDDGDPPSLRLPAGEYRVLATRGPLYEIQRTTLRLGAGTETVLSIPPLRRAVPEGDWLGADLHVHSGYSFDSPLTPHKRLRAFLAQGADVLVVTEHHRVVDPALWQAAVPPRHALHLVSGVELTTIASTAATPTTAGHANVFPLEFRPHHRFGHDLPQSDVHLGDIVAAVRELPQPTVMQLNHPRNAAQEDSDGNFFNHLDHGVAFDREQPLDSEQNRSLLRPRTNGVRDIDFDAIEVMNGQEFVSYEANKLDWFALLGQGFVRTATASSDSHGMDDPVALPRSFVESKDRRWDRDAFVRSVRAGRLFLSTGPVIDLRVNGARIGDTVRGRRVTLHLTVHAPGWIPVDEAVVYIDGQEADRFPIERNRPAQREFDLSRDGYVVVEVRGTAGPEYRLIAPDLRPVALTNPVFVDADADGTWQPPGLP